MGVGCSRLTPSQRLRGSDDPESRARATVSLSGCRLVASQPRGSCVRGRTTVDARPLAASRVGTRLEISGGGDKGTREADSVAARRLFAAARGDVARASATRYPAGSPPRERPAIPTLAVECLAGRIIPRLAQQAVAAPGGNVEQQR